MAKNKKKEYTNYAAMGEMVIDAEAPDVVEVEPVIEPVAEETPKILYGVVTRCERLNVRKHPSTTAQVVTVLTEGDKVCLNDTTDAEWYGVTTEASMNGFCMAHYIKVIEG